VRRIVVQSSSTDELRALAHATVALGKSVFVGTCEAPATVMLAASEDSGVNAGATLKPLLVAHGGRGGGNPKIAQGTIPDAAAMEAVIRALQA